MSLPRIHLVVIGHKDHGKSTLIGRLLYDSKAISEQKLREIEAELKKSGEKEFRFAFLLDSLEEERKGGLTIDIMQTPFKSKKYNYIIIDCPGHREFIKNMLTGASQADAAVLVVSAKEGIQDQTRQHAFLIKTLGINQLVVAVNKMDAVAYEQGVYEDTCNKLRTLLLSLGYINIPMIPVSALKGDNVFVKSKRLLWYKGETLIDTLDNFVSPYVLPYNKPLRCCVQDIYDHEKGKMVICKVETGILRVGKMVTFLPSQKRGLVKAILMYGSSAEKAEPGDSVGILVSNVNKVERGEVIIYRCELARVVKGFVAEVILFSNIELRNGDVVTIRCGTAERKCKVRRILTEIDSVNLTVLKDFPEVLKEKSVGEVEFSVIEPLYLEKYFEFPQLGRFVIEGKKGTVGAGIVLDVEYAGVVK